MKNFILLISVAFIAISGCKKQKLFKQIDGNWKITKIVFSGGTLNSDSVINNPETILLFEKCSAKDNSSLGKCTGKFGIPGNEANFNYKFQEDDETKLGIYATPPASGIENYNEVIKNIADMYEIMELSSSKLRIKSACCTNWPLGAETYNTRYIEATQ